MVFMYTVLITGGSGLIGKHLSQVLTDKGYSVRFLGRKKHNHVPYEQFVWDIHAGTIDDEAFRNLDFIIHLAGANISEGQWTQSRKQEIIRSRVDSTNLLYEGVKRNKVDLKAIIASSAIGFYGAVTNATVYAETDAPASDYISQVCVEWEQGTKPFNEIPTRLVTMRTGVVFTQTGGPLGKMVAPIKYGIGSALGKGSQYLPWVHIDDLCAIFVQGIENPQMVGVYNAVAPEHVTNAEVTKAIAQAIGRKIWLPNIPSFVLKLIFGEMAVIFLEGSRVSANKIQETGFAFTYPTVAKALTNLLKK
ncbi:MAG: hypothetical protein ACI9JN_001304 [Bacteroidia bacterium]|jgi:uncharacterized protein (TIGR01777 family)